MPNLEQNKKRERKDIVKWILTLEQERKLSDARFDRFTNQVMMMIGAFKQQHNLSDDDNWIELMRKVDAGELVRLRAEIDAVLMEDLTPYARAEAEKLNPTPNNDALDTLIFLVSLEVIKVMDQSNKQIDGLIRKTIESEFAKQSSMIGLDRQYIPNHIDDIYKTAVTQDNWSKKIWGEYQVELRNNVETLVRESMLRGYNPKKIAADIQKLTDSTKYEAERLMRTETARVQAQSQLEAYKVQDFTLYDIIPEPSACDKCKKIAAANPYKVKDAVVGETIQPFHPNCRCSSVGVMDSQN